MAIALKVRVADVYAQYLGGREEAEIEVVEGATAIDLLEQLGMANSQGYLVLRNGAVQPKAKRGTDALAAGDEIAILMPLKGG
ncbi:MAG: thiamine biosynthesis protein ThiS [Rhizobiales bacterium]|nr:thiamine biosynthesis protein ThiS [Hyphomicrobiales bacterium]